ncbi:hypothetical protein BPORC_1778 [Bifidobacterium porcinum]|nr:hypothetical protein BPORC_1778 [Bifidobacterium porcinum]
MPTATRQYRHTMRPQSRTADRYLTNPAPSRRYLPAMRPRSRTAGRQPASSHRPTTTGVHPQPLHDGNKNDQQATTMGVRSAIIAPDAHHHVP